jgi:hypothetical protein
MNITNIKEELYRGILEQRLDEKILDLFFTTDSSPVPKECELWDYKRDFETENLESGKTIRSICSFYNSYGGYLVFGIEELEKDTIFRASGTSNPFNAQQLKGSMDKYLSRRIDIHYREFIKNIDGIQKTFGIILVPKRPKGATSIATIKDCGDGRKTLFPKDATFIRELDECIAASLEEHFIFLNSPRDLLSEQQAKLRKIIPHNLPDKNFICQEFVGREAIIQSLWAWLSDDFDYVKVLAGEGGKGKTSIAYEFSRLLAKSEPDTFDQVVWLSAKLKQFKAEAGRFVSTPEQHYYDLESLLNRICSETGSPESELTDMPVQSLKRLTKRNLELVPSFIIIDDVDSTEPDEQKRILETARAIANQNSKILLTTRANNTYSSDIAITVPGLQGDDYEALLKSLTSRLGTAYPKKGQIDSLAKTSNGSPLFTESIFRLVKLGMPIDKAIEAWKDKSGEEVRSAALQREIEQLSYLSKRVLLAATIIGTCSLAELSDITELEKESIQSSIEELDSLFLIQSPSIIQQEPRFEVPDTTSRLVISIAEKLVPNHRSYIAKIKNHATSLDLAKAGKSRKGVGAAISQANALLKQGEFDPARETIRLTLKKPQFKDNPDLLLMLGRIDYCDPSRNTNLAINSFLESFRRGQTKEILFDLWFDALKLEGSHQEKIEVCTFALEKTSEAREKWISRVAETHLNRVGRITKPDSKIKAIIEAWDMLSRYTRIKSRKMAQHSDTLERLIDLLYEQEPSAKGYTLIIAKAMVHAIGSGDTRTINFERYAKLISKQIKEHSNKETKAVDSLVSLIDKYLNDLRHNAQRDYLLALQDDIKNQAR